MVADDSKVVSISTSVDKLPEEQIEELRVNIISLYGASDDILKSKVEDETLVWGNVDFDNESPLLSVNKIHGRAVIFRYNTPRTQGEYKISGSVRLYISQDDEWPRLSL
jgi:hypothetical protein